MSDSGRNSPCPDSVPSDEDGGAVATELWNLSHVKVARSQPRDPATGEICFDIEYDGKITRLPIRNMMDLEKQIIVVDAVADAVEDWIAVAAAYPSTRRKCICCRRRATTGRIMCGFCSKDYGSRLMLSGLVAGKPLVRVPIDPENRVARH
jgi:hypothetical protein